MSMAERALRWLEEEAQATLECLVQGFKRGDAVLPLPIDAIEVMDWDSRLGAAIMEHPDAIALELLEQIHCRFGMENAARDQSPRLWIRLIAAPMPILPVESLNSKCVANGALVQVFGVAHAVRSLGKTAFMRRLVCRECGAAHNIYPRQEPDFQLPRCCIYGLFEEDLQAALYVPYQEIYLGPVPTICTPRTIQPPLVRVQLCDEITGKINVGDTVCVIGRPYIASSPVNQATLPKSGNLFADINIDANNILLPFSLPSAHEKWTWPQVRSISLDVLMKHFSSGFLRLPSKHWSIAIFLSLVSACSGDSLLPEYSNLPEARFSRRQVHVLFIAPTSSTAAWAFLRAASLCSPRSVHHSGIKKQQLLATSKSSDGEPTLHAGSLPMSNGGICIIQLLKELLSKEDLALLLGALDNGFISLKNCPELAILCSSTIWGVHPSVARSKGFLTAKFKSGSKDLLHRQVLSKFDVVVPLYDDQHYCDDEIGELILELGNGKMPLDYFESLRDHIWKASQITSITVTEEAQEFISKYYLLLRRSKSVTSDAEDVSISTLECLLRVASACAKACLRSHVLEVPDAMLSIFLFEQTQQLKCGSSILQHVVEKIAIPSSHDGDESFDVFLEELHGNVKRYLDVPIRSEE